MSKPLTALEKLRGQVKTTVYQSTFDFASYEIKEKDIQEIQVKEEIIFKAFDSYSRNIYEICKGLYDVSLILKKDGSFMDWYHHIGLNKDKVSELLKRYDLFIQIPEYKLWVASLSVSAVKLLTTKLVELQRVHEVAELGLKSVDEIKYWLSVNNAAPLAPQEIKQSKETILVLDDELVEEFKDLKVRIKNLKTSQNIVQYKSQIRSLKKEMEELEELIRQQEDKNITKNNFNLFEMKE